MSHLKKPAYFKERLELIICLFSLTKGRCARAGRHGTAFSLVSTDDEAHLLDLYLFLNRTFDVNKTSEIGTIPPDVLEDEHEAVLRWLKNQHIVSYCIVIFCFLYSKSSSTHTKCLTQFKMCVFSVGCVEHRNKCIQKILEHASSCIGRCK